MADIKQKISCPTCGKADTWIPDNSYKPFCSERCKLIDLGEWASDSRRIAGEDVQKNEDGADE